MPAEIAHDQPQEPRGSSVKWNGRERTVVKDAAITCLAGNALRKEPPKDCAGCDAGEIIAPGTSPKLPTRVEEPEFEGPTGGDTFHLVPFSSLSLGEGQGANLPWLQATPDPMTTAVWHTWAEINPKRADEMDIREGDVLEIEASGRTMRALAYVNPTTPPDVIGTA